MRTLGIVGPGSGTLADRLLDRLDGRVALVGGEGATDGGVTARREGATTTYDLGPDGWRASGEPVGVDDLLDRLAPDHDYALVLDRPDARIAQIATEDTDEAGEADLIVDPDGDLTPVVERIDDLETHETLESLVARVKESPRADRAGAIATFTGRVRAKDAEDDTPTRHLEFEKYEGVAERRMRDLEADLEEREGVLDVVMHHRTGVIPDGEDIVFVVVLAGHRREAFRTVEDGIDRLKEEVPIFKKEVTAEETFWVHERN
ncbi:MAG: molybdopterin synthase [Haloarculaceae archaeon]